MADPWDRPLQAQLQELSCQKLLPFHDQGRLHQDGRHAPGELHDCKGPRLHQDGRHAPGELHDGKGPHQNDHRDNGHVHGHGNHPVGHQQGQLHCKPHEERLDQVSSWPWTFWPLLWVRLPLSWLSPWLSPSPFPWLGGPSSHRKANQTQQGLPLPGASDHHHLQAAQVHVEVTRFQAAGDG